MGEEGRCDCLKDHYGLSWQIVPAGTVDALNDSERVRRATEAMLQMHKLDLAALRRAIDGDRSV